ncbi:MAG TPA: BON domain-containing protein [Candidatus Limnocylindrales bacterium]|nr:BON domain-containing protein [Candidatus Limnocylindrales bacterium]
MRPGIYLANVCGFVLLTGCSHIEPGQGGAWANGPPGPSWEPDSRVPVSAPPPGVAEIDLDVTALVRRSLKEDPRFAPIANQVRIKVHKGVLTLSGEVPTARDRDELVAKISKLPGVDALRDNELQTARQDAP